MHPLYRKADQLSQVAIGSAVEVHRLKGPGLIESIYERCLMRELELRHVAAVNQRVGANDSPWSQSLIMRHLPDLLIHP